MIIVQLSGGLGNQLFQYAAARRLAIEKATDLKLDIKTVKRDSQRVYKLNHFNIAAQIATRAENARLKKPPTLMFKLARLGKRTGNRLFPRLIAPYRATFPPRLVDRVYQEQVLFQFEPEFLQVPDDIYLQGYFQDERYFKPIEALIRRELTINTAPDASNAAMAERIQGVNAVSLHIRRGDYAHEPEVTAHHGLMPLDYYHSAVDQLARSVDQPHFFIFSDDPDWAREHLRLPYPLTVVDHNDAEHDHDDLRLMSLCRHHIIANSTFSWWGAWLCQHPDKIVYAPRQWLRQANADSLHIVPPEWHRL